MNFYEGMITIKKKSAFERNAKSKALVIYGFKDKARKIEKILLNKTFSRFNHLSFKLSASAHCL